MIIVIFFKGEHFIIVFFVLIPSLEILLEVENVLNIFVKNVDRSPFFLYDLVDFVCIEVGLRRGILVIKLLL